MIVEESHNLMLQIKPKTVYATVQRSVKHKRHVFWLDGN